MKRLNHLHPAAGQDTGEVILRVHLGEDESFIMAICCFPYTTRRGNNQTGQGWMRYSSGKTANDEFLLIRSYGHIGPSQYDYLNCPSSPERWMDRFTHWRRDDLFVATRTFVSGSWLVWRSDEAVRRELQRFGDALDEAKIGSSRVNQGFIDAVLARSAAYM